jgi:phosphoribosylanthranilate isomerase
VPVTRVKICGLTIPEDAELSVDAGADAIGLVFYAPSPRNVDDLARAREIAQAAGPFVTVVALFVDASEWFIESVLRAVPINLLQFHGGETELQCNRFGHPYIKALRMKPDTDVHSAIAPYESAQGILLDTYVAGVPGGTGECFDWHRVPFPSPKPIVLAGGMTPENVAQSVEIAKPYGVDVSGGVEASAGIKNPEKVRQFIENAKRQNGYMPTLSA